MTTPNLQTQLPNFPNTDVPLACLFIHFEHGYSTTQFLQDFPEVTEEQVALALELAIAIFKAPIVNDILENSWEAAERE